MAFKQTVWGFSDVKEEQTEFRLPDPGETFLKIISADYDEDKHKYTIQFKTLGDLIEFRVYYNVDKINPSTGNYEPNLSVRNCLVGLNKAIFNGLKGIPYPDDIIGAVVMADIQHREYDGTDKEGNIVKKKTVSIWKYEPVPEDIVLSDGEIEQYYIGYEDSGEEDE